MQPKIAGLETLSDAQKPIADRILEWIAEWRLVMGLDRWELSVFFVPTLKEGETEDDPDRTWADTQLSWYYQTMKITFYARPLDATKATEEEVEHVVVHELSHSLVEPMAISKKGRDSEHTEFVVTNLERAFMNLKYRGL